MAKRRKSPQRKAAQHNSQTPRRLLEQLDIAQSAIDAGNLQAAYMLLEDLNTQFPQRVDILDMLSYTASEMKDTVAFLDYAELTYKLLPNDPQTTISLANAFILNMFPLHAQQLFQRFTERWPNHEAIVNVRQSLQGLTEWLPSLLAELQLEEKHALEVGLLHEKTQRAIAARDWKSARSAAQQALQKQPNIIPILNNLSMAYFYSQHQEQALLTTNHVLALDPENCHALANRIYYLILGGHYDEAQALSTQLKAASTTNFDHIFKKLEALSFLGDDAGVLEIFNQSKAVEQSNIQAPVQAQAHHLVAVAYMRQGNEKAARQHWQTALQIMPNCVIAQENLDDLKQGPGERHAPWPFHFAQWVDQDILKNIVQLIQRYQKRNDKPLTASSPEMRRFLQSRPDLLALLPHLLDRGDKPAREFAMHIAQAADDPASKHALRDFALSNRGPDSMRLEAARAAQQAGLLQSGTLMMFMQGQQQEVFLLNFDISDEPLKQDLPPRVLALQNDAVLALRNRRFDEAENKLLEAIQLVPNKPDLLNNLAVVYEMQGRRKESQDLIERVFKEFPSYLFGQLNKANSYIEQGRLEEALALIEPHMQRTKLHTSEFNALAAAQIGLAIANKHFEGAEQWLAMIVQVDPDNPVITQLRQKIERARAPGLLGLLSRRARKKPS